MKRKHSILLILLALFALLVGCSDDTVTPQGTTDTVTADKDAAEAVAADVGADDGGLTDQLEDLAISIDGLGSAKAANAMVPANGFASRTYDELTGVWTIVIDRERGLPEGVPYASIERTYTMQFLNDLGEPMQYCVVDGDTASSMEFVIVSGTGLHRTRRLEQHLDALSGAFTVTGLNQALVTVNGSYHREAGNSLETPVFARTLDGVLDMDVIDVVMPRGPRQNFSAAVSGTLEGTFTADITITRGDDYTEQHIEREFSIVLGDGEATMAMNGSVYRMNLNLGELND